MSLIPVYLCSFSNNVHKYSGTFERAEIDRIGCRAHVVEPNNSQELANENDATSKRSSGVLIIRSGDVISSFGDVLSLSRDGNKDEKSTQSVQSTGDTGEKLTEEEKQQVSELKQRDAEVKAHEAAHLRASGGLARGGASYEYQKGPDGRNYAVGGEVSLDTSPVTADPKTTIAKAQQIRSAALAPANPSSQDYKVAAKASQMEAEALQELSTKYQNFSDSNTETDFQTVEDEEKIRINPQSQYITLTAVAKYTAQSSTEPFATQTVIRTFA